MLTEETIARFKAFEKYDFDNDERFKAGINSLLNNKSEDQDKLLKKAKLFYYTKLIDHFEMQEYEDWKKDPVAMETVPESDSEKPTRFTFQELVDMIEKGIEIPGIKQIPNVLNEGTPSEAKMTARPKPWEIKKEQQQEQGEDRA
ncbi:uncharacterized protein B0P05DRAFT_521170 [Gilbertella persicaria]|uniref:uncharacterized protein n=1 Tax=Gilbertella persicaria TaxID=101096 RepID=UPI00221E6D34|nr:uncharacterized protein B0P05DRAFT_521170 [Gilbertella persicaria]KAI8098274.1 hypothetical protein B0P05DRAFT_521170 [Gilbertella persicaria]